MKKLYVAVHNADMTEGRGPDVIMGLFESLDDAKQVVKGWGVMGVGNGDVYEVDVYSTLQAYKNVTKKSDLYKYDIPPYFFGKRVYDGSEPIGGD